jgi:phage-related protein
MAYDLTISLTGANGDTIVFDNTTYTLTDGLKGFGIPATMVRIQNAATDGGIFRHSKRGIREVDLPIVTYAADRASTEAALRRLSNILQNNLGPATLTATYANGDVYTLGVYYAGGGETVFGEEANTIFAKWVVVLQAPNPFWTNTTAQSVTLGTGSVGRGMLPKLSSLRLTATSVVGTVNINNTTGDVVSYPIWTIYGPFASGVQVLNSSNVGFTYNAAIPAGDFIKIDSYNNTVVNSAGTNMYSNLGPAPKFFTVAPGSSAIQISGTGATSASTVVVSYYPRREVLH